MKDIHSSDDIVRSIINNNTIECRESQETIDEKFNEVSLFTFIFNLINLIRIFILYQIKKCGKSECGFCKPVRLPLDVFESLNFIPDPGKLITKLF